MSQPDARATTLPALLARPGASPALLGTGGFALTREDLAGVTGRLAGQLAEAGVSHRDRIAIACSNGPGAAIAFLGVAAAAVAAPLNPAYTRNEFEFALRDLPAALLLSDGTVGAASEAAAATGVRELRLDAAHVIGGLAPRAVTPAGPDDVALVLHTSGTTGKPKRVPLTHANLSISADNIADSLGLGRGDRSLNVMPNFHIHGLIGGVLAGLAAGGSVACAPGFDAFRFGAWLSEFQPTWFTAVPTIHQAILARARQGGYQTAPRRLRFVRSSSAPMPPGVMAAVEAHFGVPLVEAYGMTEASHQVAVNPLPPGARRPGSVGRPAGVEVAVVDGNGAALPTGGRGEVVIRGPTVTAGYEGVAPSEFLYPGGWLRTGDEGHIDADGYLVLSGRIKELINRGGEKVSPREVEEVLLTHPSVAEALVFAVPHARLGEEVGAAVVPAPGAAAPSASDLRALVSSQLAPFKVPRTIRVIDSIPLGPTGKPQRVGMAERLGFA